VGRLPKNKTDRSVAMLRQGYTLKEIAKEVHCSESSVSRIKKQLEGSSKVIEDTDFLILAELVKGMYRLLEILHVLFADDEVAVELLIGPMGRDLTEQLIQRNAEMIKRILEETHFFEWEVKPILTANTNGIREAQYAEELRADWISLLRKHWPSALADLVK
jgi:AraC-like DNA-binding protein